MFTKLRRKMLDFSDIAEVPEDAVPLYVKDGSLYYTCKMMQPADGFSMPVPVADNTKKIHCRHVKEDGIVPDGYTFLNRKKDGAYFYA